MIQQIGIPAMLPIGVMTITVVLWIGEFQHAEAQRLLHEKLDRILTALERQ